MVPSIVDETIEAFERDAVQPGDLVGVGIHTGNALRGYEVGRHARDRGATVVFGGVHATLYPEEAIERGGAHTVVKGDGEGVWPTVLDACAAGVPERIYDGGHVSGTSFRKGRWELLPRNQYMWASVQTGPRMPQALLLLLGVEDGRADAASANVARRDRGDRRAPTDGVPLHRARRRQLLPGDAGKTSRWPSGARTGHGWRSSRRCVPSGSS